MVLADPLYSTHIARGKVSSAYDSFSKTVSEDAVSLTSSVMASRAHEHIFFNHVFPLERKLPCADGDGRERGG